MKVQVPAEVPEDKVDLYARIYFYGFRYLLHPSEAGFWEREAVRNQFPEAYDAGELAAFFSPRRANERR